MKTLLIILILIPLAAQAQEYHTDIKPWHNMTGRILLADCEHNNDYFCIPPRWANVANRLSYMSGETKLREANKYINNKYPYKYTGMDWHTPLELEAAGHGDCKDHAIAKMALLIEAGIHQDNMRVMVLKDTKHKFTHAVLQVKTLDGYVYLDDQSQDVLKELPDYYHPIYSINFDGWWLLDKGFAS